jgi:hypothetical protein
VLDRIKTQAAEGHLLGEPLHPGKQISLHLWVFVVDVGEHPFGTVSIILNQVMKPSQLENATHKKS